jgi:hypothetical protein
MGVIFGLSGSSHQRFDVLKSVPYEIRVYESFLVAETTADTENEAFQRLANYIGVFGHPQNSIG